MADFTPTPANVVAPTGTTALSITAGAAINAGQLIYKDANDKKGKLAIATAEATANVIGITVGEAAADGQKVQYVPLSSGAIITVGGTVTVGRIYVLSGDTAGSFAEDADLASTEWVTICAVGKTTTTLKLIDAVTGVQKP